MHDVRVADLGELSPCAAADVERWIAAVLEGELDEAGALSVTFLTSAEMQELNRRTLSHDHPTDVIAFRLEEPRTLVGDVYVCPTVAAENAAAADVPVEQEVLRLVVHGTHHVLGHDHPKSGEGRKASAMWAKKVPFGPLTSESSTTVPGCCCVSKYTKRPFSPMWPDSPISQPASLARSSPASKFSVQ